MELRTASGPPAGITRGEVHDRLAAVQDRYGRMLLRYLTGFTGGSRPAAEDLLQETMIRVWRRLADLPPEPEGMRRWLFTVARNVGIDDIRRRRTRPVGVDLLEDFSAISDDDTTETVVAMESLRCALRALSTDHQRVLAEIYLEGRSIRETAARLGVPVGTVKSRAHYALRTLRTSIGDAPPRDLLVAW
nr:sigma-70 family RNA polymerase sigma factor [uncultured Actinoplanes sp.]